MNRFKNFIEIIVQLSSVFALNLTEKFKSILNKNKRQDLKKSDISSVIIVKRNSNQITTEFIKNKSSSKNKIVKEALIKSTQTQTSRITH